MNLRQVARLLAGFLLFFSLTLLVPLTFAHGEESPFPAFAALAVAAAIGVGSAAALWFAGRKASRDLFRKEGLAVVGLAWVLSGVVGAVPFYGSDAIPSFVDAFFESISGLTTTGATVLGGANIAIEALPRSLLLWRSMLQWMGGMGIILVFIILLPGVGVTGSRLLSSEQIGGVGDESIRPRMAERARLLFFVYAVLTAAAALGFWIAGLDVFDAVCHAFTALATGGFSTFDLSLGEQSLGVELVAVAFMFLAGCNFLLLARVLTRSQRAGSSPLHSREFVVYAAVVAGIALGVAISLWLWGERMRDDALGAVRDYSDFGRCLRDGLFQTVSIITTTGFATVNFDGWPKPAIYLLIVCMLVGGCTGSTAGGYKVLRLIVCAKLIGYALRHFVRPRTVEKLRVGSEVLPNRVVSAILALLLLWLFCVALGTLILDLDPRLDLVSAFTASLSMMGCVGPAISETVSAGDGAFRLVGELDLGPFGSYGALHPAAKLFMTVQMVLGRLEILAPLALLTPGFWKR